ncbi:hypothetical protein QZM22_15485 [Burkholderia oklahomensis]|uniref:hypothetical protein n=1 Tax=Burkholderia oklahomensis TaxID=342113 RepID=UPI002650D597|nr:hypothetical protein [Burkholderia oklahomensis]MDN7673884.1 hypothetical protein [Burkholderia oklahomensis]
MTAFMGMRPPNSGRVAIGMSGRTASIRDGGMRPRAFDARAGGPISLCTTAAPAPNAGCRRNDMKIDYLKLEHPE